MSNGDDLAAYDATYTALALEPRVLSRHDHEFVWLATLIATDEASGKSSDTGGGHR